MWELLEKVPFNLGRSVLIADRKYIFNSHAHPVRRKSGPLGLLFSPRISKCHDYIPSSELSLLLLLNFMKNCFLEFRD
jgi:hypothetical protein